MKVCKKCGVEKSEHEFQLKRHKDRRWREGTYKDCKNAAIREKRKNDPNQRLRERSNMRRYKYGMSNEDVDAMLEKQGGCAICGTMDPIGEWCIDHDHSCCPQEHKTCGDCVRGILCRKCNLLIGAADDSVAILMSAIDFIVRTQRQSAI